jgi:hypothetical protein
VANKKKAKSARKVSRKPKAKQSAAKKTKQRSPSAKSPAPRTSSVLSSLTATASFSCPTQAYSGRLLIADDRQLAFLQTANDTYLMVLDPDCSGAFSAGRAAAAYQAFRQNPGNNGQITVDGFLHEDGTTKNLHVVR